MIELGTLAEMVEVMKVMILRVVMMMAMALVMMVVTVTVSEHPRKAVLIVDPCIGEGG